MLLYTYLSIFAELQSEMKGDITSGEGETVLDSHPHLFYILAVIHVCLIPCYLCLYSCLLGPSSILIILYHVFVSFRAQLISHLVMCSI